MLPPDYKAIGKETILDPMTSHGILWASIEVINPAVGTVGTVGDVLRIQAKYIEVVITSKGEKWVITEGGKTIDVTDIISK